MRDVEAQVITTSNLKNLVAENNNHRYRWCAETSKFKPPIPPWTKKFTMLGAVNGNSKVNYPSNGPTFKAVDVPKMK